jgi:carbonic anhydrase/acetyltransferase-like protein (isoleucine patch superfamily)
LALYHYKGIRPRLGREVFVAPGAIVIGDVELGDEASVWFGTVIRGDVMPIRFGARTNLQDGSVVHVTNGVASTSVGDDVTIGHMVLLHGCTVGHGALVGMGSVLLDGSVIGDECIVAAGSLVPPRMRVPPRSLAVGRPARIVRAVTEDDLAWVRQTARRYVQYARTFSSADVGRIDDPSPRLM